MEGDALLVSLVKLGGGKETVEVIDGAIEAAAIEAATGCVELKALEVVDSFRKLTDRPAIPGGALADTGEIGLDRVDGLPRLWAAKGIGTAVAAVLGEESAAGEQHDGEELVVHMCLS